MMDTDTLLRNTDMIKKTAVILLLTISFCASAYAAPNRDYRGHKNVNYHQRHYNVTKHYRTPAPSHYNYQRYYNQRYNSGIQYKFRTNSNSYKQLTHRNYRPAPSYRNYRPASVNRPGYHINRGARPAHLR